MLENSSIGIGVSSSAFIVVEGSEPTLYYMHFDSMNTCYNSIMKNPPFFWKMSTLKNYNSIMKISTPCCGKYPHYLHICNSIMKISTHFCENLFYLSGGWIGGLTLVAGLSESTILPTAPHYATML